MLIYSVFNAMRNTQCAIQKLCAITIIFSLFLVTASAAPINLDKAKEFFLKGDYAECIKECENILAYKEYSKDLDELYYLLALSYLKQDNFLRASDIFEIIINEFKDSAFKEDAMLGLGDTSFLRGDYDAAKSQYEAIISLSSQTKLKPVIYFRLAQINMKKGSWEKAQEYLDKLKKEYPLSFESRMNASPDAEKFYFTVQVGAFSKSSNAQNLSLNLKEKGYDSYIDEVSAKGVKTCRVRVGRFSSRFEAEELAQKLSDEGYPTKIFP